MTDKVQKIREEVEKIAKSINPFIPDEDGKNSDYEAGKLDAATQILQIIDSLEEPVSENLEKEIYNKVTKLHTAPCFDELANFARYFANWQKQQMMKEGIDGLVTFDFYGNDNKTYGCIAHDPICLDDVGFKDMDKVKMILIKED